MIAIEILKKRSKENIISDSIQSQKEHAWAHALYPPLGVGLLELLDAARHTQLIGHGYRICTQPIRNAYKPRGHAHYPTETHTPYSIIV